MCCLLEHSQKGQFPRKIYHIHSKDFHLHKPLIKLKGQITATIVGFPELLTYIILSVYWRPGKLLHQELLLGDLQKGIASHLRCGKAIQTSHETILDSLQFELMLFFPNLLERYIHFSL